jgi:hypothetical protein
MLSVSYAECHRQTHYAECHYAEWRYAECRGGSGLTGLYQLAGLISQERECRRRKNGGYNIEIRRPGEAASAWAARAIATASIASAACPITSSQ